MSIQTRMAWQDFMTDEERAEVEAAEAELAEVDAIRRPVKERRDATIRKIKIRCDARMRRAKTDE